MKKVKSLKLDNNHKCVIYDNNSPSNYNLFVAVYKNGDKNAITGTTFKAGSDNSSIKEWATKAIRLYYEGDSKLAKAFKQNEPNIYDYTLTNVGKSGLKIKFNTVRAKNLFVLSARKTLSTDSITIDKKSESAFIAWAISHDLKLEVIN